MPRYDVLTLTVLSSIWGSCNCYGLAWLYVKPQAEGSRHQTRDVTSISAQEPPSEGFIDFYENLTLCTTDHFCGRGSFCDRHYAVCLPQVEEGGDCRRDGMCTKGHDCVFGQCQKRVRKGLEGARCRRSSDCNDGLCCARRHGQGVCQQLLPLGHKCYVPGGGLEYSLNEMCPCESGLVCKFTGTPPTAPPASDGDGKSDTTWRFWTAYEQMRCAPPFVSSTSASLFLFLAVDDVFIKRCKCCFVV
ncbi:dickkopf-related protein 1-like [Oratosquilla oratoria]|uniref:dickkopf-related protein 1-like n=1 Tax=Oratosquilla oratoria TaxID=337810 RepID=UPI003F76C066